MINNRNLSNTELINYIMDNWGAYVDTLLVEVKAGRLAAHKLYQSQAGVFLLDRTKLLDLYDEVKLLLVKINNI